MKRILLLVVGIFSIFALTECSSSGYIDNVSEIYEISEIFKAARNEKKMTDVAKEEIEKMCDELKVIITDSKKESKEEANELIERYYKTLNQQNNIKILIK